MAIHTVIVCPFMPLSISGGMVSQNEAVVNREINKMTTAPSVSKCVSNIMNPA